jgi:hypothetical protein
MASKVMTSAEEAGGHKKIKKIFSNFDIKMNRPMPDFWWKCKKSLKSSYPAVQYVHNSSWVIVADPKLEEPQYLAGVDRLQVNDKNLIFHSKFEVYFEIINKCHVHYCYLSFLNAFYFIQN